MCPLVHAINASHLLPVIYLLFEKRIEAEVVDNSKCSLVHWAAYQDNINILKILDHFGIVDKFIEEKDTQNQTPIFKALYKKNWKACKLLMGKNCDTTQKDANGLTPKEFVTRYFENVNPMFVTAYEKFEIRDII